MLTIHPTSSFSLLAASGSTNATPDPLADIERWTEALQEIDPHVRRTDEGKIADGQRGVEQLIPLFEQLKRTLMVEGFRERGAQAWFDEWPTERDNLSRLLAEIMPLQERMVLRGEAGEMKNSIGRTRPVTLLAFGKIGKGRSLAQPTEFLLLNREFEFLGGRALITEAPFGGSLSDTIYHRYYFADSGRENRFKRGFEGIPVDRPWELGALRVGALVSDRIPELLASQISLDPVDILLISGLMPDDRELYSKLSRVFSPALFIQRNPILKASSLMKGVGSMRILSLAPTHRSYGHITFDPKENTLEVEIIGSQDQSRRHVERFLRLRKG